VKWSPYLAGINVVGTNNLDAGQSRSRKPRRRENVCGRWKESTVVGELQSSQQRERRVANSNEGKLGDHS
jgi:hypothetical protein